MKKMVCEICGSRSIKKVNGVFVCQECGTEYSLEEAKKLLVEVDDVQITPKETSKNVTDNKIEKNKLIKLLSLWIEAVVPLESCKYWFNFEFNPENAEFWKDISRIESFNPSLSDFHFSLNGDKGAEYFTRLYIGDLMDKNPKAIFDKSSLALLVKTIIDNREAKWQHMFLGMVAKEGYNVSIRSKDGDYSKDFHDMSADIDDVVNEIVNLSKTNKEYFINRIVPVVTKMGFKIENKDTVYESKEFDATKVIAEANDFYTALVKYDQTVLERYLAELPNAKKEFSLIIERIKELEEQFFAPYQYRNPRTLYSILNILTSGRADDWKEAVAIYETDMYRDNVILNLKDIKSGLMTLNKNIIAGFAIVSSQLNNIDSQLWDANYRLSELNDRMAIVTPEVDYMYFDKYMANGGK